MAGLGIIIPRSGGSGPIISPPHDAGAAGYTHRYIADRAGVASGVLATWPDVVSGGEALTKSGSGSATVMTESGVTFVRLSAAQFTGAIAETGTVAVALVIRRALLTPYPSLLRTHGW